MCRNSFSTLVCFVVFLLLAVMTPFTAAAADGPFKVSLMMGDYCSRLAVRSVEAVRNAHPELSGRVAFEVPSRGSLGMEAWPVLLRKSTL